MPAFETMDLYQWAVLWPATGYDGNGQPIVGSPVAVLTRWLTRRRTILDAQGNNIALDGQVIIARFVPEDSLLWLDYLAEPGTGIDPVADWTQASAGTNANLELVVVKSYNQTSSLNNRFNRYELGTMRYKGTVPS